LYKISPNTLFIGREIFFLPTCHSTNDIAASLFKDKNVSEGTTVITSHQTAGRGQRGNTWEAAPGKNLTFSILLKPAFIPAAQQFNLNMAISVAIYNFLTTYFPEDITIKWPNDLYHQNKKISGMLIENTIKNNQLAEVVVGIGLNVNQVNFAEPKATSMQLISGNEYSLEKLYAELLTSVEQIYLRLKADDLLYIQKLYSKNLYFFQKKRLFKTNSVFEGKIVGVDAIGRLLVERENHIERFLFKEIEFV
jgi:BirA family transcriptional regulator, biotin operon repressor / biotin---[acetyl-CoA-carboxylase] ligase